MPSPARRASDAPRGPRLRELLPAPMLAARLPAPGRWRPYPDADDRRAWGAVDPAARELLLSEARRLADEPSPVITAGLWARWGREGDRAAFEDAYFERRDRLAAFALAAALSAAPEESTMDTRAQGETSPGQTVPGEGGRFLDLAADEAFGVCEESSWCLPPHDRYSERAGALLPDPDEPYLDLFAAETGSLLAHLDLVLGARFDARIPGLRTRLRREVRRRVLRPYRGRDDWPWYDEQANNWNPWIHSNVLAAGLLLNETPEELLDTAVRVVAGLDNHLDRVPADGGCDEGAMYWWRSGATLFECLDTLHRASAGALSAFDHPLVRAMARYPLATHIDGPWQVNYADGTALRETYVKPSRLSGNPPDLLHRFGRRIGDRQVCAHARAMRGAGEPPIVPGTPLSRTLGGLFDAEWAAEPATGYPYLGQTWLPDTEVLTVRARDGSAEGLFLSAKGGHNDEGHNHNDVGTFVVALDGVPVLVDAGVGDYHRDTFGPDRYSIWTMRGAYHNLPEIDGVEQAAGAKYRGGRPRVELGDELVGFALDLAGAYPPEAGARHWWRTLTMHRSGAGRIELDERWELDHEPGSLRLHLMTPREPRCLDSGAIHLAAPDRRTLTLRPDAGPAAVTARVETIELTDRKLVSVWGRRLFRLTLDLAAPARDGRFTLSMSPGAALPEAAFQEAAFLEAAFLEAASTPEVAG
ncbi:heparinase II/III family protein [Rugosimonospora acidiphila]|uniref:Heparinase II/III family protein n=1 Tax=Rugosimonospora acidiphila TaxID=556531 RepID=A0ABP9SCX4_9ACTN